MNNQTQPQQQYKPSHQNQFEAPKESSPSKQKTTPEPIDVKHQLGQIGTDLGHSLVHEAAAPILSNAFLDLLGQERTQYHAKPEMKTQDENKWKKMYQRSEQQRQEEQIFFQQKLSEQQRRIGQVRDELQKMTHSMGTFAKQAEDVAFQAQTYETSDVYTENFFLQLLSFITKLRARINSANKWLHASNAKAGKKGQGHPFMKGKNMQVDAYMSGERSSSFGG